MVYDAEKARFATIITNTVQIPRTRDSDLEREAQERTLEAREQTGLNVGSEDGLDDIQHPTATQRAARLGVPLNGVYTAELAIWKYLVQDPILALANGLLSSAPHRAVLDNPLYKYWGIGIYSEMPPTDTDEIDRRWWAIVWLSNVAIGSVAVATPSETVKENIHFAGPGVHYGYKFSWDGKIMDTKSISLSRSSRASSSGRSKIVGRAGNWLLVLDGGLAGYWVLEEGFVTVPAPKLTA